MSGGRLGFDTIVRKIRYERYSSHSTSVDVRRASHAQYTPHAGLAQIGPVRSTTVQNASPTSAADTPSQSHFASRLNRKPKLPIKHTINAASAVIPQGACR